MTARRIVTLSTDFGTQDTFAGQMKGAALSVHPHLEIVDLTHEIPPHDVAAGAYLLATGCAAFPQGTIHVAVVDPGVGSTRRGIVVRTHRYFFVAPDNGILTRVLEEEPVEAAHVLEAAHLRRSPVSATFEGRDIFAPAAAWVARGTELHHFGPPAGPLVKLDLARSAIRPLSPLKVRVLAIDRFGNAVLDLSRRDLAPLLVEGAPPLRIRVEAPGGSVTILTRTYAEAEAGHPFLVFNSADLLEIATKEARAAEALGLEPGTEVTVTVGG